MALCLALGRACLPRAGRLERLLAGATLGAVLATLTLRILGGLGLLYPAAVPLGLAALLAAALFAARGTPAAPRAPLRLPPSALLPLGAGAVALGLAVLSAFLLPVWQWDALGYHLPWVNFVLQAHGLSGVPPGLLYLSRYPHGAELLFAGLRLLLPDDGLVDLGQIFFGLLGALAIAGLARRAGAQTADACVAGALWLTVPAVFLQLPTDYVDVAVAAYFLLAAFWAAGPVCTRRLLLAGLALGLLIGAKPSAPLCAALLCGLVLWRAAAAGLGLRAVLALCIGLAPGAESYALNLLQHGNPVWPVGVHLGPLVLPGQHFVTELLTSAPAAPRLAGPLPLRVLRSWAALVPPVPAFDMRVGGFGPLFLLAALPAALWVLARKARGLLVPFCAALAAPDPAVARYTLAFPGVCLALFAVLPGGLSPRARAALNAGAAALALAGLATALPGLTGEAPLVRTWKESPSARARALGPEGPQARWIDLRDSLAEGESAAFDRSFELSYLLWRPDLKNRVVHLESGLDGAALRQRLDDEKVAVLVAGRSEPAGRLARADAQRFRFLFSCVSDDCDVYRVIRAR